MSRLDRRCRRCGKNFEDCPCSLSQEEDHLKNQELTKKIQKEVQRQIKEFRRIKWTMIGHVETGQWSKCWRKIMCKRCNRRLPKTKYWYCGKSYCYDCYLAVLKEMQDISRKFKWVKINKFMLLTVQFSTR